MHFPSTFDAEMSHHLQMMDKINAAQFEILTPAFVFCIVLIVFGVPGNIFSISVYGLQLKSAIGRHAIIILAICDVINCVMSIPVEIYIMTRYFNFTNAALCKMSRFFTYAMNNSSGLILVAIAFERYRSICCPHKRKIPKKYIKKACLVLVFVGIILALPVLWIYGIQTDILYPRDLLMILDLHVYEHRLLTSLNNDEPANGSFLEAQLSADPQNWTLIKRCMIDDDVRGTRFAYSHFGFITIAVIGELLILIIVYGKIAKRVLGLRSVTRTPSTFHRHKSIQKKKHATLVMFLITLAFQLSFVPFLIITNLRFFTEPSWYYNNQDLAGKMAYHFFLRSYLINSAVNPFIYCMTSQQFRTAAVTLSGRWTRQKQPRQRDQVL